MALVKGTNSYVEVSEADAYFGDRVNSSLWTNADNSTKEAALITATRLLDNQKWISSSMSANQSLAFPRYGFYYDTRYGYDVSMESATPQILLDAIYELALHLITNPDTLEDSGNVRELSVGSVHLGFITGASKMPSSVTSKIGPLLLNGGRNSWWRAN